MIVSPIPGQTPDRSSEHTLQGLASNLNAYAEEYTPIATAGTAVVLTPGEVIAKNLRLEAGASGAFTLTLPPTSKIIDALGATVSIDGSYWFPLYIFNRSTGQTATLVAGDSNTTVDAVNAAIPDGHVNKWMVNVERAPNAATPMTLNFHTVFSVCCSGVQPQTCPPDLPPVLLQFGSSPNLNSVLQYDLSSPGSAFGRVKDAATLGTGTISYAPSVFNRSAIYNVRDDKMYFIAEKTNSVGPAVTEVLVQFDPRTLQISGEMVLPSGLDVSNTNLIDVSDEWAWITTSFDNTVRAFDLVSFTEVFNDSGIIFSEFSLVLGSLIACASGQFVIFDPVVSTVLHLITVTGPSTFTDTAITVIEVGGIGIGYSNDGSFRRLFISDRNKVFLPYNSPFTSGDPTFAILDLNNLSVQTEFSPSGHSYYLQSPWWDSFSNKTVAEMSDQAGGSSFGIFVGSDTGGTLGFAAFNSSDWANDAKPLGGLALSDSLTFNGYGGFDEQIISTTPTETYETSDNFVSPAGNTWSQGKECIALRRPACQSMPVAQQGGSAWESPVFHSYVPFSEGSSGQTITDSGGGPLQYFNAVDTAGWFDVAVGSPGGIVFTPKIRGYYAVEFGISAQASTGSAVMYANVVSPTPPGAGFAVNSFDNVQFVSGSASDIVHCNGSSDTISLNFQADAGHTWTPGVASPFEPNGTCYFNVWLLKAD